MHEDQRSLWTMSVPVTSNYNHSMQEFTDLSYATSEQHKESREARISRDTSDMAKISSKLDACSRFSSDPSLRNIINGLVARPDVNVHEYETIGGKIIEKMSGQPVFKFAFKRSDKAKTLADVSAIKIAPDQAIDPALLFQRFLVVSRTADLSLEEIMKYELSPFPPALFEAKGILRKPDKPQLAQAIWDHSNKVLGTASESSIPIHSEHYVLDGGSLLHRVPWKKGDTYGNIAKMYADFTIHDYGSATVVFDGYRNGPSIKDNTHQRRGHNIHPVINFTKSTEFSGKKQHFLARDINKQQLIDLITEELKENEGTVINALGDADVDIVKAAVEASTLHSTTLIGEDTDLSVLLLYHATTENKGLYFRSDNHSKDIKVYDINQLRGTLGQEICCQLIFVHAFTGCDSTSRIFGVGKKSTFQKIIKGDPVLQLCAKEFVSPNQKKELIQDLGNQAMIVISGAKGKDSLASLRYSIFSKEVVSGTTFVSPECLPPKDMSTKYHSLRVYYQIMAWTGQESDLNVLDWGWRCDDNQLVPVMTDLSAAPDNLMKMIHCNCSTACSTPRCTCRRNGLRCTPACGPCQLQSCDNLHNQEHNDNMTHEVVECICIIDHKFLVAET